MARSAQWDAWVAKARAVDIVAMARARPDLKLKSSRNGRELVGPCPRCGGDDRFAVTSTARKRVFHCRGCGGKGDVIALQMFLDDSDFEHAVEKLTGAPKPPPERKAGKLGKIVATYPYSDESDRVLFEVVRYDPKDFRQRRPNDNARYIWHIDGVRLVPYRLPRLLAAVAAQQSVLIVEGEKDVATAEALGLVATCAPGGVGMGWRAQYDQHFGGGDVVVVPDNDVDPNKGPAYARSIAGHLTRVAQRVRMLTLPAASKDLTAWVEAGGTRAALDEMIAAAPDFVLSSGSSTADSNGAGNAGNGADDDAELERLAKLPPMQYEQQRRAAAERLSVRASMLDRLVRDERTRLGLDGGDSMQGQPISFPEPAAWLDPVDGAALLDEISKTIGAHVIMSDDSRYAAALWIAHTFLLDQFVITPRLAVCSPVKRCGKTTLLDIVARLVLRPLSTASVTAAAVFRVVESVRPCLLVDEADTFLRDNEELRGVLNSGHRRGGAVLRTVGDEHEPRMFATYSACAIALIGRLPDTLADRAVTIHLERRKRDEPIEALRLDRTEHLDRLASQLARWAHDHGERIGAVDPSLPSGIYNRDGDNWRPLLAIADIAGGTWPQRARNAAIAACGDERDDDGSRLELLLGDIRDAFAEHAKRIDDGKRAGELPSADLVAALVAMEGHPWTEMGRGGKSLTAAKLARMLKSLDIKPVYIGPEKARARGYVREHFEGAFERYLPPEGLSGCAACADPDSTGTSSNFKVCSQIPGCTPSKSKKPPENGDLHTLHTLAGGNQGQGHVCAHCGWPGGNEVTFGDGPAVRLHPECEAAFREPEGKP